MKCIFTVNYYFTSKAEFIMEIVSERFTIVLLNYGPNETETISE